MNTYELLGREKKASALIDALHQHGWGSLHLVRAMGSHEWAAVAQHAGVKPPSAETIKLVIERLERSQKGQGA